MNHLLDKYGNMLFDTAQKEDKDDSIYNDIIAVKKVMQNHPDIFKLIEPALESSFVNDFNIIADSYIKTYFEANNIMAVTAITSIELTDDLKEMLVEKLGKITSKRILLSTETDTRMIGGIKLEFEKKEINASIENKLSALKKQLLGGE